MRLSVVIPTLNESAWLPTTLATLRAHASEPPEVIVADCASTDSTVAVAIDHGASVVAASADGGRAGALAAGSRLARGDVLLFLDADTLLPCRFDLSIQQALADSAVVGGAFEMHFSERAPGLPTVERLNRLRYRLSHLFYGDQAVFARRQALETIGGVPQQPLMESAILCRRLKSLGHLVLLEASVATSARRFLDGGVVRVFAHDLRLWLEFLLRLPVQRHAGGYWRENRSRRS